MHSGKKRPDRWKPHQMPFSIEAKTTIVSEWRQVPTEQKLVTMTSLLSTYYCWTSKKCNRSRWMLLFSQGNSLIIFRLSVIHDEIKSSHQTNLVKLQGHFDKMFGYIVSPTDQDVVGIDNFPFLQKSKSVSRNSKQCDKLTKLRVFIARYTSFMMSWGLLCDRIPKCHLALLIGLPRWVFSVVGLMPSTTARSRKAAKRFLWSDGFTTIK